MTRTRHIGIYITLFTLIIIGLTSILTPHTFPFSPKATMSNPVTHTVLFQFKQDASPSDVKAACDRFLALKHQCLHPTTQSAYITSLKGGKDNSPEGLQNGITHCFVAEFASAQDRDYYVKTDPAHQAFVKSIEDLVEKAIVVDFNDGVY